MNVVFIDWSNPRPYQLSSINGGGIGGTEASIIRIAEEIDALVVQHNRTINEGRYRRFDDILSPTHVVTLRRACVAVESSRRYPKARHFLWMHDLATPRNKIGRELIANSSELSSIGTKIICVSKFHRDQVRKTLEGTQFAASQIASIYNSVPKIDIDRSKPRDPNKLIFFSAPYKGLGHAVRVFRVLRTRCPKLSLFVANPGYGPDHRMGFDGVVGLGALPHREVLQHVSTSLCAFLPNFSVPETFGLVLAESNSVGTPVLTHPLGAAPEILGNLDQIIPVPWAQAYTHKALETVFGETPRLPALLSIGGFYNGYLEKILKWRSGDLPVVRFNPEFSLESVSSCWLALLNS
jgi:glycosyltransferase involved in cell wall biosynthesis